MATHSLAIAKASLAAGLMRPDPTSVVPHTEISQLHTLLETLLRRCSPGNIQLCKDWLLRNTLPSAARTTAFGKYLVALSVSLGNSEDEKISRSSDQTEPSTRRKQLHILYLLNDLLHHTKFHLESSVHSTLTANIQTPLINLIETASAHDSGTFERHRRKIQDLLAIWVEKSYFDAIYYQSLREAVDKFSNTGPAGPEPGSRRLPTNLKEASGEQKADAPFIMPSAHGDISMPYYDLPAGNMMPHIIPNSATPINPQILRPLQFIGGPAEETLVTALKEFLREVDSSSKSGRNDDAVPDVDELGNIVVRDITTGDLIGGEGYYGWSRAFCEKMKRRRCGTENAIGTMGGDQSFDISSSPRKRRRYSFSESSGDWDRGRSRSRTPSRSSSEAQRRASQHKLRKRSYSRSRSVSRAKRLPRLAEYNSSRARSESRSRSVSTSESYSPPQGSSNLRPHPPRTTLASPPIMAPAQGLTVGPPPPFSQAFHQDFSHGPGGLPIPPPPPPNYQGPWPPPPPPLPPTRHPNMPSTGTSYAAFPPFASPLPSGGNRVNPGSLPIGHGPWSQQSASQSGNYPYSGSAPVPPAFNVPGQNQRSRPNQGGW
ncbi:hypothetical protein MMC07_009917 [Pseudocyphellaria aurata]|nr:hypothetical protein [Pseudocyphellaria aurata]